MGDGGKATNVNKNWVVTAYEFSKKESSGTTPDSSAAGAGETRPATSDGKVSENTETMQDILAELQI